MTGTTLLSQLFPGCVATACRPVSGAFPALFPEEEALVARAVEKRRREFAAGRACAREALAALGSAAAPILHDDVSAPVWPAGIIGALSHSYTWAGAALARRSDLAGLGLDIETVERVTMSISRKVLTETEAAFMERLPDSERKHYLALAFSIKESVYKCLAPLVAASLNFSDACIRVIDAASVEVRMGSRISRLMPACETMTGRYFLHEGCVFSGICLKSAQLA
jgi:phosphopantetheine--protein transferase-like protein